MPWNEADLQAHLKSRELLPVYILYGQEPYLASAYADRLANLACPADSDLASFNLHHFDGQECAFDDIEQAAEALPLMAERKCVVVRDYDAADADRSEEQDRLVALLSNPPDTCVMIFWMDQVQPDPKHSKWKPVLAAAESTGAVVTFKKKTAADLIKTLQRRAAKLGCTLKPDTARLMVEQSGDDLHLLLNELDKLAALAGAGVVPPEQCEITRRHVETAGVRQLEARVFDLSKAILNRQYARAYQIVHNLFVAREDPVAILAVLSGAYADLYRVKIATAAGQGTEAVAQVFSYGKREFVLQNAARDCARLSVQQLRDSLEVLAEADRRLKSTSADNRVVIEQTVAKLIVLAQSK